MRLIAFLAAALVALPLGPAKAQSDSPEWTKLVAAAEEEGSVVLRIPAGNTLREFFAAEWPKAFPKIRLDASPLQEAGWIQRVRVERGAGKFLWDGALAGSVTTFTMKNSGFTVPIVPELVLPDVKDERTWGSWEKVFFDNEHRYVLATQNFLKMPFYNARLLPPERVKALGAKVFLDPSLKGRIIWHDPLMPGSGETFAVVMHKLLGDAGLRSFVTEQVVFTANMMDLVEKMARGQYAISMGPTMATLLRRYENAGLDFDIRPLGNTPEIGAYSNTGGSNLIVMKDAPHPNAMRVFVNWLVSKEVATKLAKHTEQDSNREDIPSQVDPARQRVPGAKYIEPQRESSAPELKAAHELIREYRRGKP